MNQEEIEKRLWYNLKEWNLRKIMKWNKKFKYPSCTRSLIQGKRHYDVNHEKLPSVTTILAETKTKAQRESLQRWQERIGKENAIRIRDQAAARGTIMHSILEAHLAGKNRVDLTDLGKEARIMAQQIIEQGLTDLDEIWGSEVTLYYPELYAGATDVVGVYDGQESICDFKQSNKPKRREWIGDYFLQLGGYAMAHNHIYGTKITQGVVLICTKDNLFQRFVTNGSEFVTYQHGFLERVSQYYDNLGKSVSKIRQK